MGESSELLQQVSETQILRAFQRALVALYPILRELDCISDDTQPYDPFDRVADALWDELVLKSLQWKYGLDAQPQLPPYGYSRVPPGTDGYIRVDSPEISNLQFVGFIGDRSFGSEPFNAIAVSGSNGISPIPFGERVSFQWQRN